MFGATVLTANARELIRKACESPVRQEKKRVVPTAIVSTVSLSQALLQKRD